MKLTLKQALIAVIAISLWDFVASPALSQIPRIAGLEFEGFSLNQAQATITYFVGDCPGREFKKLKAHFFSSANLPAKDRRVVIRNLTEGVDSRKVPYSDRKYDQGIDSQGISLVPGTKHKTNALVFIPNKINTFDFIILQNKQVIEQGLFEAVISINTQTVERNANWQEEFFCTDTGTTFMSGCKKPGVREKGSCPSGNLLSYPYRNERQLDRDLIPSHLL